jgi:hypothetical protein
MSSFRVARLESSGSKSRRRARERRFQPRRLTLETLASRYLLTVLPWVHTETVWSR